MDELILLTKIKLIEKEADILLAKQVEGIYA